MARKYITVLILFMVIGFALVTTTLTIKATIKLSANNEQFEKDIVFTYASATDTGTASIIKDGKEITYNSKKLVMLGDEETLNFIIKNKSTAYDALVTINCVANSNDFKDYVEVKNNQDRYELAAGQSKEGSVTVRLIKSYAEETDQQVSFTCTLDALAKSIGTYEDDGEVNPPSEIASPKITFNANGGEGEMSELTVDEGETITLPNNKFSWEYHGFAKWNTKPDGSGDEYLNGAEINISEDITLYAQWAYYGTEIQSTYENIYTSLDSKNPYISKRPYYIGNYHSLYNLMGYASHNYINSTEGLTIANSTTKTRVLNGTNTNTFTKSVSDEWVSIHLHAAYWTTYVSISNLKIIFGDGNSYYLSDAVKNGYIEPLVLYESSHTAGNYLWVYVDKLIEGGSTERSSYPWAVILFKVKTKANLTGLTFTTNQNWDTTGDGIEVMEYPNLELSITPF